MKKQQRQYIPVEEVFAEWEKDPDYRAAYDALEEEFSLVSALIQARVHAKMTQEQVAKAMGTTQAAVARLESGHPLPSTRTLKRFADATGTRLNITFSPKAAAEQPSSNSRRTTPRAK